MTNSSRFLLPVDAELELRLIVEWEAEELFHLIDTNRSYLRQWLPWVDAERSLEDSQAFIQRSLQEYLNNEGIQMGIYYQGRLVGVIGCHSVVWSNRKVEIGYWMGAQFQGKGLMTRACRTLIDYVFEKLLLNRVEIRCATGNTRSCAIPQRLGFKQEGISRESEWLYDHFVDLVIYGLLAREWQTRQSGQ